MSNLSCWMSIGSTRKIFGSRCPLTNHMWPQFVKQTRRSTMNMKTEQFKLISRCDEVAGRWNEVLSLALPEGEFSQSARTGNTVRPCHYDEYERLKFMIVCRSVQLLCFRLNNRSCRTLTSFNCVKINKSIHVDLMTKITMHKKTIAASRDDSSW